MCPKNRPVRPRAAASALSASAVLASTMPAGRERVGAAFHDRGHVFRPGRRVGVPVDAQELEARLAIGRGGAGRAKGRGQGTRSSRPCKPGAGRSRRLRPWRSRSRRRTRRGCRRARQTLCASASACSTRSTWQKHRVEDDAVDRGLEQRELLRVTFVEREPPDHRRVPERARRRSATDRRRRASTPGRVAG